MDSRTEDQRLRGVIPVVWGGEIREVPTLKRGASREWREKCAAALAKVSGTNVNLAALDSLSGLGNMASDEILDLVTAYDASHVLGSEEWIDGHVDDVEVYAAFRQMLEVAYPFVRDVRGVLTEMRAMVGNASPRQASTSTPSPSGASRRRTSTPD